MATYLVLIYGDEQQWDAMTPDDGEQFEAAHRAFRDATGEGLLGGHELARSSAGATLRSRDRRMVRTDGPFLEAKEVLGGYYVVEAEDLEAAVALASLLPEVTAGHSGVEIRPVAGH